ncbi:MAG TPA: beta-ketoacyl synthase chain length factor [Rhodocyclaceae bacterium]|nr:beta-ketoacyl synthase chain length factor [Rhodocyclaceae bacterium]
MSKWVAWGCHSTPSEAAPNLGFIDALLRRRLSPLARAALHAANICAEGHPSLPMVYASRHGELGRTIEMLRNLANREDLSPTTFSLSVLNSAAGIFSIARGDQAPATAVSAGMESFGFGLLEAWARAALNPDSPVLYLYADTAAPYPVGPQTCDPESPLAVAMLIGGSSANVLEVTMTPAEGDGSHVPQALACLFALEGKPAAWHSGERHWQWKWATEC